MANSNDTAHRVMIGHGTNGRPSDRVIKSNSVTITVRQPAATVLHRGAPPPVKAKPKRVVPPPSAVDEDDFPPPPDDFPPPPPEMMQASQPASVPMTSAPMTAAPAAAPKRTASTSLEDELDSLTDLLMMNLENTEDPEFFGICHACRSKISGEGNGCTAMGEVYHVSCFVCAGCKTKLTGLEFYCVNDSPYCENCYMSSLEECSVCGKKITERILRAVDTSFHPECFECCTCHKNLDGVPFTVDATKAVHCVECYQMKFSPRCAACQKLIMPTNERGETVHIVSMQKNFHVQCYKCEDCNELLSSEEGRGCYPLDGHLLCQRCNVKRVQQLGRQSSQMSTEL